MRGGGRRRWRLLAGQFEYSPRKIPPPARRGRLLWRRLGSYPPLQLLGARRGYGLRSRG
jgi:hypothetical protein